MPCTIDVLDHDTLQTVGAVSLNIALVMAVTCKDWRDAIEQAEGGVFDTRQLLLNLGETALLTDLHISLALSTMKLKLYEHTVKRRHGGGCYKIFHRSMYISIYHAHGAASGLEDRQARRAKRQLAQSVSSRKESLERNLQKYDLRVL